jgi:hypothetical protein
MGDRCLVAKEATSSQSGLPFYKHFTETRFSRQTRKPCVNESRRGARSL